MKKILLIAALAMAAPTYSDAGPIGRACLQSDRSAASQRLCNCIQKAANGVLSRRDQRLAAKFFRDPQRAQDVRQSDRAQHEAFWQRYRNFGQRAESFCRG